MSGAASGDAIIQGHWLDAVGDVLSAAFILFDRDDEILAASRQLLVYFPVSPQFIQPGTPLTDFLGAVYDVGMRGIFGGHAARNAAPRGEWIGDRLGNFWRERCDVTDRLGVDRWLRIVKRRLPDGRGLVLVQDPTEHKRREEHWRTDMERVQLTEEILDSLPYPLFVKDRNLTYVAVNRAYCALRGKEPEEMLGKTLADLMPAALAERFDSANRQVLNSGMPVTTTEQIFHPDGRQTTVLTRKMRLGRPGHYFLVGTIADASEFDAARDAESRGDAPADLSRPSAKAAAETCFPDRLLGGKVLIVSRDRAIEQAALAVLRRFGVETCCVRSAAELDAFLTVADGHGIHLDLVAIDRRMPERCGAQVRRHGAETLTLDPADFAEKLGYFVVRHFNRLAETLSHTPEAFAAAEKAVARQPGIDVLVAEDNDLNRIVFSHILDGLGYGYVVATDGAEAVEFWALHRPAIVLMDTTLPVMDGFDAARMIRQREGQDRTPIIGVLPQAFADDRQRCMAAGMDDVIVKPLSPEGIEAVFSRHLRRHITAMAG